MFIIKFEETGTNKIFLCVSSFCDSLEDVMNGAGDNTSVVWVLSSTFHREGFSCSSLTIGEDGAIIAFKNAFDDGKGGLFKDGLLLAGGTESCIVSEVSGGRKVAFLGVRILHCDLSLRFIDIDD
jgi:hypothetical protein